jgi:hypothetical protein
MPLPYLPSRVGESVGRELVLELVDSVRDGTSGMRRSSADRLEDNDDDPRPLRTGICRAVGRLSSSTVSHPASFAVSSSCSSSEWHDSRVKGVWVPLCGARGCSTMISVSSMSCSPQPTFQETYSKRSKRRTLRSDKIPDVCSPRESVQLSTASQPPPESPSIPASRLRRFGRHLFCGGGQRHVIVISGHRFPSVQQLLLSWYDCATSIGSQTKTTGPIGRSGSCPPSAVRMRRRREADRTIGRAGHSQGPRCPARDWGCAGSGLAGRDSRAVRVARAQHKAANRVRPRVRKWDRRGVGVHRTKRVARADDRGDEGGGCS